MDITTSTKKREEGKMKKKKVSKNGEIEKSGKKVRTQIRAGMNKAEIVD